MKLVSLQIIAFSCLPHSISKAKAIDAWRGWWSRGSCAERLPLSVEKQVKAIYNQPGARVALQIIWANSQSSSSSSYMNYRCFLSYMPNRPQAGLAYLNPLDDLSSYSDIYRIGSLDVLSETIMTRGKPFSLSIRLKFIIDACTHTTMGYSP